MEIDKTMLDGFRSRYAHIHSLIFWRSIEKARTLGDLFDILEDVPASTPVVWSDEAHGWKPCRQIPEK